MAINKNHEFEDLNGVKCAIVEKNISQERVDFLKELLGFNGYIVVVVAIAPPKAAPAVVVDKETEAGTVETPPPASFTVGVTDVCFNVVNAVFGRLLKTKGGQVVTLAYWQQKETVSREEIPYFAKTDF